MSRLLIISLVYEPDTVSTATITTGLATQLRRLGHDVTVLTSVPHFNPPERGTPARRRLWSVTEEEGGSIVRCYIPRKPTRAVQRVAHLALLHLLLLVAVVRWGRRREGVLVISPPLTLAIIGFFARALGRGRLVYNVQELWPDVPRDLGVIRNRSLLRLLTNLEGWIYRSADAVAAIGPRFAEEVRRRGARRVFVVPNPVDTAVITPQPKDNALARRWGVHDRPMALYAGNIGLTQDFDVLLEAARLLEPDGIEVCVVGGGAGRAALEHRLAEQRLSNVRLFDFLPRSTISEMYGAADVVLVPLKPGHDRTTTPSKIFSAMAAGRPLVVTAELDTDVATTVLEAEAGVVVAQSRPHELAQGIRTALDGTWRDQRALAVAAEQSPAAIARRYDALFAELLGHDASAEVQA